MSKTSMTPDYAWDVFVGNQSPLEWSPVDVSNYVATSPMCEDLSGGERQALARLLTEYIEECQQREMHAASQQAQLQLQTWWRAS